MFNEVDALISDVSSVIPDFLYSEKPFVLTSMVAR
jgi:CDP-glycerol glycerophosphotransferase (TagB/SpsB family)